MKLCDLHTHSVFSDGTDTPEEIVKAAVSLGLSAVALCDHNTVGGLPSFLKAAEGQPIEAVAGAELSVDYNGGELHLLALFIPERAFGTIDERIRRINEGKRQSNRELIASLNRAGYPVDYESLAAAVPGGIFNRAHVAAALVRLGAVGSINEAFHTLLSPRAGHYRKPRRPSLFEMLPFIRAIGAVSVLAHPFLDLSEAELIGLLPDAREAGLVGMECYYPLYDEATTATALGLAERFSLLPGGGSDYHGGNKPDIALGLGRGDLRVPYALADALREQGRKAFDTTAS